MTALEGGVVCEWPEALCWLGCVGRLDDNALTLPGYRIRTAGHNLTTAACLSPSECMTRDFRPSPQLGIMISKSLGISYE